MTELEFQVKQNAEELKRLRNQPPPWLKENDVETALDRSSAYERVSFSGFTTSLTTVWAGVNPWGAAFEWPTSAVSLEVLSDNAADTSAGAGARTVILATLDDDFAEQLQEVSLNGATPVGLTGTHRRVNGFLVNDSGTIHATATGTNTGTITCRVESAGATHSNIPVTTGLTGIGRNRQGHYTVPVGKTAVIVRIGVNVSTDKTIGVALWGKPDADDTAAPFTSKFQLVFVDGISGIHTIIPRAGTRITGPADLWIDAISDSSNSQVFISVEMFLVDS